MNILLIRPKPSKETIGLQHVMICEPLELEYLAANIEKKDVNVEIIDMILEKRSLEYFIKEYNPKVVGMSGYITHVNVIKDYANRIKAVSPNCKVVIGGVHAEVLPQDFISKEIDFIVEANGLKTFNTILDNLELSEIESTDEGIQGTYREGKKSLKEASFNYLFPDRKKVARYRHKYYYMFHNPCALIKTSFGCPYNCSFCYCKEITEGKYFARSIDSVIQELKQIPEPEIYIVDDDFLFSRERILEFCLKLKQHNIQKNFLVYGRTDFVSKNEDVIKIFREHGLSAVIVGLESFRNQDLTKYNKRTSISQNEEAIRILQKYEIEVYGTLILGMDFSKEDFVSLYKWIRKMGLIFVNLQPLTPLKGTEIYEIYEEDLAIKRQEFEKWDLAHLVLKPEKMTSRRYYYEITIGEDKELLKMVVDSGCIALSFGLESISAESLKSMDKSWANPLEYGKLIENIQQAGIDVSTEMVVGADGDSLSSIKATAKFIKDNKVVVPRFYILTPIPGTKYFKDLKAQNRIYNQDIYSYNGSEAVHLPKNMTPEELTKAYWDLYEEVFSLGSIIKRTIIRRDFFKKADRYLFYFMVNLYYRYQIKQKITPNISLNY